jgi:hypothetical protein
VKKGFLALSLNYLLFFLGITIFSVFISGVLIKVVIYSSKILEILKELFHRISASVNNCIIYILHDTSKNIKDWIATKPLDLVEEFCTNKNYKNIYKFCRIFDFIHSGPSH